MFGLDDAAMAMGVSGLGNIAVGLHEGAQNRQQMRHSDDLQREFAQNGISWKVEDAKRAGLHPLAALGMMPGPAYQPMHIGDAGAGSFREAGQNLAKAASMGMSQDERNRTELENQLLMAQIQESDARKQSIMSDIATRQQNQLGSIGVQKEGVYSLEGQAPVTPGAGVIDINPSAITSSSVARPSMEAGIRPGEEQRFIGGMPILLPQLGGESAEEIISEMSPAAWAGLLARNSNIYGKGWLNSFLKMRYLGHEDNQFYPTIQQQQGMSSMREPRSPIQQGVLDAIERAKRMYKGVDRPYKGMKKSWRNRE